MSEPSQIAPLFDLCDDSHNHAEVHTLGPQLGELARSAEEKILNVFICLVKGTFKDHNVFVYSEPMSYHKYNARLDTCVTVIDAAEFYTNLDSMKEVEQGETTGTIAELLMEQVRDIFFLHNPGLKIELSHQRHFDFAKWALTHPW